MNERAKFTARAVLSVAAISLIFAATGAVNRPQSPQVPRRDVILHHAIDPCTERHEKTYGADVYHGSTLWLCEYGDGRIDLYQVDAPK